MILGLKINLREVYDQGLYWMFCDIYNADKEQFWLFLLNKWHMLFNFLQINYRKKHDLTDEFENSISYLLWRPDVW